jgi:ElaB/YqjD/DUF883 family membrane-anchored ribosome-binding protein
MYSVKTFFDLRKNKSRRNEMDNQYGKESGQGNYPGQSSGTGSAGGTGTAARMKEDAAEKISGAKEKVAEFGRKAADSIDAQRTPAANALDRSAAALQQTGDRVGGAVRATGDKLKAGADYLRENDLQTMMGDVNELVKRYPGQSLAAAVVAGFLLGRVIRSSD